MGAGLSGQAFAVEAEDGTTALGHAAIHPLEPDPAWSNMPESHDEVLAEILRLIDVADQTGLAWHPSETRSGPGTGRRTIASDPHGQQTEVSIRLFGGDGRGWHALLLADGLGNLPERDPLHKSRTKWTSTFTQILRLLTRDPR